MEGQIVKIIHCKKTGNILRGYALSQLKYHFALTSANGNALCIPMKDRRVKGYFDVVGAYAHMFKNDMFSEINDVKICLRGTPYSTIKRLPSLSNKIIYEKGIQG